MLGTCSSSYHLLQTPWSSRVVQFINDCYSNKWKCLRNDILSVNPKASHSMPNTKRNNHRGVKFPGRFPLRHCSQIGPIASSSESYIREYNYCLFNFTRYGERLCSGAPPALRVMSHRLKACPEAQVCPLHARQPRRQLSLAPT